MLVNAVNATQEDLTSVGGHEDGLVQDSLVYEIDIETNDVLFKWSTLDYIKEFRRGGFTSRLRTPEETLLCHGSTRARCGQVWRQIPDLGSVPM